jgi:hypothetical protein
MFEIKITGSGNNVQIAEALQSIALEILAAEHEIALQKFGKCEWEGPCLMTVVKEA